MDKTEALCKLNNQLNTLGSNMTFTWYNSTEFLIKELFGENSSHFESLRELKNIDIQQRNYDNYIERLKALLRGCIKDVENEMFFKTEPSKGYKKLWKKYYSGGYTFESSDELFNKELGKIILEKNNKSISPNVNEKNIAKTEFTWTKAGIILGAILTIAGIVISILIARHVI